MKKYLNKKYKKIILEYKKSLFILFSIWYQY